MIIRKLQIENYLCYFDSKTFELSDGLNIILGENGEGKTKFFEAIDWLFNGENRELDMLVSAKKLNETIVGESFRVRVSMTVEQYEEQSVITRSFLVMKENESECSISNFMIEGITENKSGERTQVDGQLLLDRIFPFQIRKYSMFKGESELNIFDSESALANLISLFSEAKHFDKYSEKGAFLRLKAEKAVEDSSKLNKKNEVLYKGLEREIIQLELQRNGLKVHFNSTEGEIKKIQKHLQDAERHVNNADALETLNKRIKEIENRISNFSALIDENYTTNLFDENWILMNFEPFQKVFSEKVADWSKKKRKLQKDFDREIGFKQGAQNAKAELLNNAVPLPDNIPSKAIMEEMLSEEICKVCNRPANPRGSKEEIEAYNFMMARLKAYLESQVISENEPDLEETLFVCDYTSRLENLSISQDNDLKRLRLIKSNIKDVFEFNDNRKKDIEEWNEKLEKEISEREKILGNSSIGPDKLIDVLKNYNAWQKDLKNRNQEQLDYSGRLKKIEIDLKSKKLEKDNIEMSSAQSFLIKTRNILRDIELIFSETKEMKFDEFIEKLQTKSNNFFKKINIDSFTGTIVFSKINKSNRTTVEIELQENGRTFYKPNQALLTSMHISILFAISELASETKEENFPMIFDAPTSSFGENKTTQFLNLIFETGNQKILLVKDFLFTDKNSKELSVKKEFENVRRDKAFWVKLERPFDSNDLKSINSQVIVL